MPKIMPKTMLKDIQENTVNETASTQPTNHTTNDWLDKFQAVYQHLSKHNLNTLASVYHEEIYFEDPLHKINGLPLFIHYFEQLFTNVITCTFTITHSINKADEAAIYWTMHYQHPKLNAGNMITVTGHSHLKASNNKIIYHRDYLDAGAMLYEHIPLLGRVIRYLKNRIMQ